MKVYLNFLFVNRWRTKQNLDYAYLMMYAQAKGTFYVQVRMTNLIIQITVFLRIVHILFNTKIKNIFVYYFLY